MTVEWTEGHFIGGDAALDLANTVWRRTPEPGADLLDSPAALDAWLAHSGVVATSARDRATPELLAAARSLRAHLWSAVDAQRAGDAVLAGDLAGVLDHARSAAASAEIGPDGEVLARSTAGAVAALALRALRLLLTPPAQGIRACDGCGWFFVDTSRGRRRRWCSMRTCGNQHKVARYRTAHRSSD